MGSDLSRALRLKLARNQRQIVLVGLDSAGKTTLLGWLRTGERQSTIPTLEASTTTVSFGQYSLLLWDVGGQSKLRPFWRHYLTGTQGVIYVVDSTDIERLQDAKQELEQLAVDPQLEGIPFLILANKQDMPHALNAQDISERLETQRVLTEQGVPHPIRVQQCTAVSGAGVNEGLEWLCSEMKPI